MKKHLLPLLILSICPFSCVQATYVYKNGTLVNKEDCAEFSQEEHFNRGITAIKEKKWEEALHQFRIVNSSFPDTPLAKDALYFLGVSYFHNGDIDLANKKLSKYLSSVKDPKYFIETFQHKFAIAEKFNQGARKHLFSQEKLPRLFKDREAALAIYDEIATSLPTHELATKALFAKAEFLANDHSFSSSISAFQELIRKFPKTDAACQSYLKIAETLLVECIVEKQNPDLLPLAEINLTKFESAFPKAEKELIAAKEAFKKMQETYAEGLYETGAFYERKGEPKAAVIYYMQGVRDFPTTMTAKKCKERLQVLDTYAKELQTSDDMQ